MNKQESKQASPQQFTIAIGFLVICVLIGLFVFGGSKLASARASVGQVFENGVDNDGLSIANDLKARSECAYNLISLAERTLPAGDQTIADVTEARSKLDSARDPADKYQANLKLTGAVDAMYNKMKDYGMSASDEKLAAKQYAEMGSRNDTISHDGYNEAAANFNSTLHGFPAGLISAIRGVGALPRFM